jgi:DNA-binding transcriptional LysR family regulator
LNWNDVQLFLAVARFGRVSAAARRLGIEHTTVARRVTALETALGVSLFYRTRSGYVLTPNGSSLLPKAEAMEQAAIAASASAREPTATIAGCVRVAMPPEFASHWLAPTLPRLQAERPRLQMQVIVGTRQRDLSRGEADLALQDSPPQQTGMVVAKIGRAAIGLYAARALLGERRLKIATSADLRGLPLLAFMPQYKTLQNARWFQPILASGDIALTTNSTETLLAAARAGLGVSVLPRFVARRFYELVAVSDDVAAHDIFIVMHPELRRDPKVRAVADFLKRIARGPQGLA